MELGAMVRAWSAAEHPIEDLAGGEPGHPGLISTRCLDLNGSVMPKRTPWSQSGLIALCWFMATSSRCRALTSNTWKLPSLPTGRGSAKTRVVAGLRVEGGTVRVGTGSTEPTCWIAGAAADQVSEAGEDQADKQSVHR